jgi:hypothetical protein
MGASKKAAVPVSKRALVQRINRKLLKDRGEVLKATRGGKAQQDLGDYYTVDLAGNFLVEKDVDLGELGRELGVLAAYERLVEGD